MREIIFRGKRLDNGEWIEGHLIRCENGRTRICESKTDIFCYEKDCSIIQTVAHETETFTVGQYTGLKDKNGKRIFEGDILGSKYDDLYPDNVTVDVVKWFRNGWYTQQGESLPDAMDGDGVIPCSEVIGNIHDNPELLEEENEVNDKHELSLGQK